MTMLTAYTHVIITRYVTTQALRKRRKEIKRWMTICVEIVLSDINFKKLLVGVADGLQCCAAHTWYHTLYFPPSFGHSLSSDPIQTPSCA